MCFQNKETFAIFENKTRVSQGVMGRAGALVEKSEPARQLEISKLALPSLNSGLTRPWCAT